MGSTRDLLGRVLVVASDHHYDVHPAARCLFKPALNGVSVSCNQCQLAPDGVTIDPLFGLGSPPSFSSAQSKGTEMNFADTAERTAFRAEFRRWIEENLPPEICVDDAASQRVASAHGTLEKRTCIPPAGLTSSGLRNTAVAAQASCNRSDENYFRARPPLLPTLSALKLLGPTLIQWGTEQQETQLATEPQPRQHHQRARRWQKVERNLSCGRNLPSHGYCAVTR